MKLINNTWENVIKHKQCQSDVTNVFMLTSAKMAKCNIDVDDSSAARATLQMNKSSQARSPGVKSGETFGVLQGGMNPNKHSTLVPGTRTKILSCPHGGRPSSEIIFFVTDMFVLCMSLSSSKYSL